jgi:DNA-directed RNA polymerase specialized sigma24 family protein
VWTALAGFTGASSFTTWLYRIVVNRCLNRIRHRRWGQQALMRLAAAPLHSMVRYVTAGAA